MSLLGPLTGLGGGVVTVAAVGFFVEKDRLYAGISSGVLAILLYSLLLGR